MVLLFIGSSVAYGLDWKRNVLLSLIYFWQCTRSCFFIVQRFIEKKKPWAQRIQGIFLMGPFYAKDEEPAPMPLWKRLRFFPIQLMLVKYFSSKMAFPVSCSLYGRNKSVVGSDLSIGKTGQLSAYRLAPFVIESFGFYGLHWVSLARYFANVRSVFNHCFARLSFFFWCVTRR